MNLELVVVTSRKNDKELADKALILDLREQVAALESKEVCTQPHDDDALEGCPYCKIEEFRKDVTKRMACKHLPSSWTKRWVCSYCCEIIDNRAAKSG